MSFSSAFKAYCEQSGAVIVPTLEVSWPGGEPGLYSTAAFPVAGIGHFVESVQPAGFGSVSDGYDPRVPGVGAVCETTVTLIDADRAIMRVLEGSHPCRRAAAVACWGSPALARADWDVVLSGIVDRWSYHDGILVDLTIRSDARWLDARVPKDLLAQSEWADLPATSRSIYMPVGYGRHDGQALSGRGFVPTVVARFSAGSLRWDLVSLGACASVPRVYQISGGTATLRTASTHYVIEYPVVGGKTCTVIRWLSGHIPAADDVVQCDVDGLTSLGDGSGTLITNPVSQIRHWLVNFGHGRWKTGSWLADSGAPIDTYSWSAAEEYASRQQLVGSFRLGGTTEQQKVEDVLTSWLESWRIFRCWWTPGGKLALRAQDLAHPGFGDGDHFDLVRPDDWGRDARPAASDDVSGLVSRVSVAYLYEAATGKSWAAVDVQDLSQEEQSAEAIQNPFSQASF